jgi:hypothetical protein
MNELGGARPPRATPEHPGRLSPDQPVWEVDGGQRLAEERHAAGHERRRRPLVIVLGVVLAIALGLFAAGITVGAVLAGGSRKPARSAIAAATSLGPGITAARPRPAPARQVTPPACLSAVDDADAVISYLVANVRDQRLARSLQRYRAASLACRRAR